MPSVPIFLELKVYSRFSFSDSVSFSDVFFSVCFDQVPVAKRRPAAASKRGGKGRSKRATVRPVRKPSLKKDKVNVEISFVPARPDKPLPACGWARSNPDGNFFLPPTTRILPRPGL